MNDHDERLRQPKKPQLTAADKALLEAEPDWERLAASAKRLLATKPDRHGLENVGAPKRKF